jgi:hypothetical protein
MLSSTSKIVRKSFLFIPSVSGVRASRVGGWQ